VRSWRDRICAPTITPSFILQSAVRDQWWLPNACGVLHTDSIPSNAALTLLTRNRQHRFVPHMHVVWADVPSYVLGNVAAAFSTSMLAPRSVGALCIAILVTAAVLLPLVTLSGFVSRRRYSLTPALTRRVLFGTFFMPGLLEETIYRAAMLPRLRTNYEAVSFSQVLLSLETENAVLAWQAAAALAVFVAMHPVNGIFLRKEAGPTFCDWRFLSSAAVLVCAVSLDIAQSLSPWSLGLGCDLLLLSDACECAIRVTERGIPRFCLHT
jgi:hypothetical protein